MKIPFRETILHGFVYYLSLHKDKTLVSILDSYGPRHELTYLQFADVVLYCIEMIDNLKIPQGKNVIFYLKNTECIFPFFLACSFARLIPVPITEAFSPNFITKMAKQCETEWIFCPSRLVSKFESSELKFIDSDKLKVHGIEEIKKFASKSKSLEQMLEHFNSLLAGLNEDSIAMIQPTSGSTGVPKLVMRTHASIFRCGQKLYPNLSGSNFRVMMTPAFTHTFGIHMMGAVIALGGTVLIPEKLDIEFNIDNFKESGATCIAAVPRVIKSIFRQFAEKSIELNELTKADFFPDLKFVISAGGKPDENLIGNLANVGIKIVTMYGSSEASVVAMSSFGDRYPEVSGKILDDVTFKLGEDSELLIKSPGMMKGYLGSRESVSNAALDSENYYRTGDIVEILPGKQLKILGRKKDVFSTFTGYYIYPERIESLLEQLSWVMQVVLVGNGKPYVTALLFLKDSPVLSIDEYVGPLIRLYVIDPLRKQELYQAAALQIADINKQLEPLEKIGKFAISASLIGTRIYKNVGGGKLRKQRSFFNEEFKQEIDYLYTLDFVFPFFDVLKSK